MEPIKIANKIKKSVDELNEALKKLSRVNVNFDAIVSSLSNFDEDMLKTLKIKIDKELRARVKKPTIIHGAFLNRIRIYFPESVISSMTTKAKIEWDGDVDKLIRLDGYTYSQIEKAIQYARNDSFWQNQFKSLLKLRRKNRDGIKYIDVFLENSEVSQTKHGNPLKQFRNGIREASKEEVVNMLGGDEKGYEYNKSRGYEYCFYDGGVYKVSGSAQNKYILINGVRHEL